MKSSAVTDGLKRLWANTYKSKPRGKPANAKSDFQRHEHGDHFPIDRTVTGGAGGCLNPRVFSGVHFHADGVYKAVVVVIEMPVTKIKSQIKYVR